MSEWENLPIIYDELLESEGFTFITNKNVLLKNDNYLEYGRYSVANEVGHFWVREFENKEELRKILNYGVSVVMSYFDLIEEENPLLCPLFPTFGGWIKDGNTLIIDPVSVYRSKKHALTMGQMYNQECIFDFKTMKEIKVFSNADCESYLFDRIQNL